MAAKYIETITDRAGSVLPGATVQLLDNTGALVTTYTDPSLTTGAATDRSANDNGLVELYVEDGVYTIVQSFKGEQVSIRNVQLYDLSRIATASDAAVANKAQASAIGIAADAEDMGAFTSDLIPDGSSAKGAIEALSGSVMPLADQEAAEEGSSNTESMSPLRVKQAVDAQALGPLASPTPGKGAALVRLESGDTVQAHVDALNGTTGAALVGKSDGGTVADVVDRFTWSSSIVHSTERFSFGMEGVLQSLWGSGFENNTRHFIGSPMGRAALVVFTRASDNPTAGDQGCYALGMFAEQDSPDKSAWSWYSEIRRRSGAARAHGAEMALFNEGNTVVMTPYNPASAEQTDVLRLSVGRLDAASNDISTFIAMVKVGAAADKGIVIGSDALVLQGGVQYDAINLAQKHTIQWWISNTARGPRIRSDETSSGAALQMVFTGGEAQFQDASANALFRIGASRHVSSKPINISPVAFANLPSGQSGDRHFITDGSVTAFGSNAAGGGSNRQPVYYDGAAAAWKVG